VPLLLENNSNLKEVSFSRILVVDLEEQLQIERVKQRDQPNESIIENIIKSQVSRKTRLNAADDVISNTNDITTLQQEVEQLHQKYLELSGKTQ
jgi:dephospho-CoA kinase